MIGQVLRSVAGRGVLRWCDQVGREGREGWGDKAGGTRERGDKVC